TSDRGTDHRVPHLRDGFLVAKVGHVRGSENPVALNSPMDGWPTSGHITNHRVDGVPHLTGVPIIGCPIFATVSSSLRWVIFAAAKIPLLSTRPWTGGPHLAILPIIEWMVSHI